MAFYSFANYKSIRYEYNKKDTSILQAKILQSRLESKRIRSDCINSWNEMLQVQKENIDNEVGSK
jgi:hypothetical protein